MSLFPPAPEPQSKLKRYRRLAPSAGVYVSPLQLGGMSIGNAWNMGSGDKEDAFKLLDAFFEAGGNFIDTANSYHAGLSEEWIGEWVESRGVREQVVIATKYTDSPSRWGGDPKINQAALLGNNIKSLVSSLEISLKRLRTSYVDIFYMHWWDYASSIEEVMNALHNVVVQGKALYLGASNTPAWVISEANRYAKMSGKSPFVIYQGSWNILSREFEREMIPMARAHGMALAPWNIFKQGKIRTDAEEEERRSSGKLGRTAFTSTWERTEDERKMCKALEKVAAEVGAVSVRAVALAYLMHKTAHVFPLLGVRNVEQLKENISALDIHLTAEHMQYLESILPFDLGGPHDTIGVGTAPSASIRAAIVLDWDPLPQPIRLP